MIRIEVEIGDLDTMACPTIEAGGETCPKNEPEP
jgi:hypothetical protein